MQIATAKNSMLFTCLSRKTNPDRLKKIESLERNGFHVTPNTLDYRSYLHAMADHLFVASPQGNGIDCHRTWEALYLGSTPLVDKGEWLEHFSELGIVEISDWNDVTLGFLSSHFSNRASLNLSKLTLSFWISRIYDLKNSRN